MLNLQHENNLIEPNEYLILDKDNFVIGATIMPNEVTQDLIDMIISVTENAESMLDLSDFGYKVPIGSQYINGKFKTPNPSPENEWYTFDESSFSWEPTLAYPNDEPVGKYMYANGQWVLNPSFVIN